MRLDHDDENEIRDLLVGKSVAKITDDSVLLSDGNVLTLVGNCGGCACGAGDYELSHLIDAVNGIMDVQIVQNSECTLWQIFVLAQDKRIELAAFEGDDGNGYYGTGFWIEVKPVTEWSKT